MGKKTANAVGTLGAALALVLGGAGHASAFHDGGAAYCEGCHTMHNSVGNKAVARAGASTQFQGLPYLLLGADQSSTCLNCHAGSGATGQQQWVMTYPAPAAGSAPGQMTPGGDFAYLTKSYAWTTSYGQDGSSPGERHGHNVVAADYGLSPDSALHTAPGGTATLGPDYDATKLGCQSCHDPHGRYRLRAFGASFKIDHPVRGKAMEPIGDSGSYGAVPNANQAVGTYRLLAGYGYLPSSYPDGAPFGFNPPVAVAPTTYNRSEAVSDTRVAYGGSTYPGDGMGSWCSNCHREAHKPTNDLGQLVHPTGPSSTLGAAGTVVNGVQTNLQTIYNRYKASGDLTGSDSTAYLSLVPFQSDGYVNPTALAALTGSTQGPASGDSPMCLSCHRAHASAWDSMTRWNNQSTFLTVQGAYPGTDAPSDEGKFGEYATGKTQAEYQASMYGRPAPKFATYQRSLCNKCHGKD